jgi:hypothetical protein
VRILKPVGEEIEFDSKVRHLLFNVNVIDDVQEHFDMYIVDVLNYIFEVEDKDVQRKSYDTLSYVLSSLLNEDVRIHNKNNPSDQWEEITEDFIKEEVLTNGNSPVFASLVLKSFNESLPKHEEDDPNQKSGQKKK